MNKQTPSPPQTKADLLSRIQTSRQALEAALQRLTPDQMTHPVSHGWSVKDALAHLTAWESGVAALLQRQPRYPAMGLDQQTWYGDEIDVINQMVYLDNRERPLSEVLARFEAAHQRLLTALNNLPDADLEKATATFQPEDAVQDQTPIIAKIIGNTYEHYEEHLPDVEAASRQ